MANILDSVIPEILADAPDAIPQLQWKSAAIDVERGAARCGFRARPSFAAADAGL